MKFLCIILFFQITSIIKLNSEWVKVYDIGRPQLDLDCSDAMNCISVGSRGIDTRLVKTTDGGYNWFTIFEDLQKEIYNEQGQVVDIIPTKYKGAVCIDFVTPSFVVVGNKEGQITISRDGGVTWDSTNLNTNQDFKIIKFTDSLSGIALTNNFIFLTSDGGVSWNNITSNFNYSGAIIFQSAYMKDKFIYAGGFFSTDKGNTWTKSNPISNIDGMYGVYFIDSLKGWCSGRRQFVPNQSQYTHTILHTSDGGKNWFTQLDTTIYESPLGLIGNIYFTNEDVGITWGDGNVIWITTDGGNHWSRDTESKPITNNYFKVMVLPSNNINKRIANIYFGGAIWMYEDLTSINEKEINVDNINIYPNPSNDFITISFEPSEGLKPSEGYQVQIFDMLGIEIMSESIHPMTGSHRMNVEKLPAGVYFIRIGDKVEKFVKM